MRKYQIFYDFGITLNMTKTAKNLFISQPAVSQTIKELELDLNVKLFEKINKKIYLTNAGKIFWEYSKKICNLDNEAKNLMKKTKKIVIGASTTIGIYILPKIIQKFLELHSDFDISIKIENTENIVNYILNNDIDFAYIEGNANNSNIISKKFLDDELIFIQKYQENQKIIDKISLKNYPLILREKGSGTREILENYLNSNNISYNLSFELGNTEAIKKVVEAGMGISCISKRTVENEINNNKLSQFFIKNIKINRNFILIYHKDKFLNNSMLEFIEFSNNYKKNL
ncbi:MAG: hypothetical protein PWP46_1194 [Fusobacteriaceae bacterium]|jgi:DNA-binding transcriptional LysR family regulator|nr:hypothetical protein [Fusobacteriaceae bacterium]